MDLIVDDSKSYKVINLLLLESSYDLFSSYLTNRELGVLDNVISDINLRFVYLEQAARFYLYNKVQSLGELEWILKRNINITKCRLDFDCEGKENKS